MSSIHFCLQDNLKWEAFLQSSWYTLSLMSSTFWYLTSRCRNFPFPYTICSQHRNQSYLPFHRHQQYSFHHHHQFNLHHHHHHQHHKLQTLSLSSSSSSSPYPSLLSWPHCTTLSQKLSISWPFSATSRRSSRSHLLPAMAMTMLGGPKLRSSWIQAFTDLNVLCTQCLGQLFNYLCTVFE